MPPKKKTTEDGKSKPAAKKAQAKSVGGRKMPPPMPKGAELTDFTKKTSWTLGSSIGKGGFGEIYSASKAGERKNEHYVVKIEPHENGPLFTELSFYRRVAKRDIISDWCQSHDLAHLSVPEFVAAGDHTYSDRKYRFMVMHQYGEDIEKKFTAAGRQFGMKTVCYLALRLLEALEFLHSSEYVHADVKGSNLLTGLKDPHQVFLVDYGLAYRYSPDGVHKDYSEDPRRQHDGTIEFTSIDAHKGVNPSRRADLEIVGYCLLQWAAGRLPWEDKLENKDYVAKKKMGYKSNVGELMTACFHSNPVPSCLRDYMKQVFRLEYTQDPDYTQLKKLFQRELKHIGCKDDSKGLDWLTSTKKRGPSSSEAELKSPASKKAKVATGKRQKAPLKDDLDTSSSADEKEASTDHKPAPICVEKPSIQRAIKRRKVDYIEDDNGALPTKRVKVAVVKESESSKKQEPVVLLPKAAYPPELGYFDGKKSHKKQVPVKKVIPTSAVPLRRSSRNPRTKI
ncbi:serine/threonine-protein kinase VRK1-like isoform X2 [Halichondria panicea]|uniref:serine/threonine-protein kinase VRK1-like isoform X2 n=1 Tax=Halichondria panicea TaxID=6063 RepID=UPI00312B77BC